MKETKKCQAFTTLVLCLFSTYANAQNSGTWNPGAGNDVGIETTTPDGQLEIVSPIDCSSKPGDELALNSAAWRTNAFVITRQWTCPPLEYAPGANVPHLKPLMWMRTNYNFNFPFTPPHYQTHLFLDPEGRFALGTETPDVNTRFHLVGNGLTQGSFDVRNFNVTDWSYSLTVETNNDKNKALAVRNANYQDLFVVWGNGVVNTKKIYAEELQVLPGALGIYWPDYVFDVGYKLRPLVELEAYVKSQHHLPDVPSTAEVKESGLNVGEMNRMLLKKVEELTLYVIDLQKQVNELKKQNSK